MNALRHRWKLYRIKRELRRHSPQSREMLVKVAIGKIDRELIQKASAIVAKVGKLKVMQHDH